MSKQNHQPLVLQLFLKSLVYRVFAMFISFSISFYFTNDLHQSIYISLLTEFVQFLTYFCFEICWSYILEHSTRSSPFNT